MTNTRIFGYSSKSLSGNDPPNLNTDGWKICHVQSLKLGVGDITGMKTVKKSEHSARPGKTARDRAKKSR